MSTVRAHTGPQIGRSIAFAVTAGVLLGTAGTASAFGPAEATPAALGALRLAVGAVALLAFLPWLGGSWANIPHLLRRPTIWIVAAGSAAYQLLFFGAVARSGVALSTLVAVGAGPVFTGLLSWAVLRNRPNVVWAGATALAIVGLLLRSSGQLVVGDVLGLVMALGAGLCSAAYIVAAKAALDRGGHVVELPCLAYLLGTLMLTPLLTRQPLGWLGTPGGVVLVLYLGVVSMALANVFHVRGLRGLPPGPAATLQLADPMTATVLGVLVLGETIAPLGLLGLVLVLVGMLLQGRALGASREETVAEPAGEARQINARLFEPVAT